MDLPEGAREMIDAAREGDIVGIPILPPYYALRLLPFIVPEINGWRRRLARERDYLDAIF